MNVVPNKTEHVFSITIKATSLTQAEEKMVKYGTFPFNDIIFIQRSHRHLENSFHYYYATQKRLMQSHSLHFHNEKKISSQPIR